ncbi:hypothetical protein ACX80Z_14355 [Arthrobacter sp. TMT4-20]
MDRRPRRRFLGQGSVPVLSIEVGGLEWRPSPLHQELRDTLITGQSQTMVE